MSETRPRRLVVLTGAGISAESGLKTFRDGNGLWEDHAVEDVATPEAWARDPGLVLRFYDARRDQVRRARPNPAHQALARLEQAGFAVHIVTQNIDDLHERAGSSDVLHLHGEVLKARSSVDPRLVYPLARGGIRLGDLCDKGSQLRPHVVWFGEAVPAYPQACDIVAEADLLLVVGTSLAVMPAAMLIDAAPVECPCLLVDPKASEVSPRWVTAVDEPASTGVPRLVDHWLQAGALSAP
ncbi:MULTISPECIES: Sir2 family NAD-dependent protein deacetylase [Modicisalibacter]|uniref:SIR2 family NAD-dependent protein deacylase n=1 Tax=Modicisalibacter TaxID=574347 RepID=UPI00100C31EB|nr:MULTISPECIES: Sir2 family NAD-dependent protein deacetylase [Halomonadaceae]MBZ9559528.1 NAD-dependent deacylase [Modicisalibacter sp. R2A 31.J]MBZ9576980.1 NAD-dependent deacylase [Modicisalibacter sp. MOD 31.J]